jgi:pimeloyl-ACP methyl ester carboxylesterase
MRQRTARRDDIRLAYVEDGLGSPPLVFIHGGLSSHHAFEPQLDHFSRTHRVLAPDLRGHGRSAIPDGPYSIETLADDVAVVCLNAGVADAVVVGHSLGGLVGLELARRHGNLVRALVLVESPVVTPPEQAARSAALLSALRGDDYAAFVAEWARRMVLSSAPYAERIAGEMQRTPQRVAVSLVEHMLAYDSTVAIATCGVPLMVVGGAVDRARLSELCPNAILRPPVGASHYGHLDAPEDLDALVEAMLVAPQEQASLPANRRAG